MTQVTTQNPRSVCDVDRHVSETIRTKRLAIAMSQEDLAGRCGVTFQQIQKYERGRNRVSAGRLHQIANALGEPVEAFFPRA